MFALARAAVFALAAACLAGPDAAYAQAAQSWTSPDGRYGFSFGADWRVADKEPYGGDEILVAVEPANMAETNLLRVCTMKERLAPGQAPARVLTPEQIDRGQSALNTTFARYGLSNARASLGESGGEVSNFNNEMVGSVRVASFTVSAPDMTLLYRIFALATQRGTSRIEFVCGYWSEASAADIAAINVISRSLHFNPTDAAP